MFQEAIAADPNYALAYAGLADTYNIAPSYISLPRSKVYCSPTNPRAKLSNSMTPCLRPIPRMPWRWPLHGSGARPSHEFQRAIELNPNDADAHYFYALAYLGPENRLDDAQAQYRTALSLDPLSSIINTNYAVILMVARHYPESLAQFQKVLDRDPNFPPAHYRLSQLYATTGRFPEAVNELRKVFSKQPRHGGRERLSQTHVDP